MKPQDIIFIIAFCILLFLRKPKLFILSGIASLILSIPLFAMWVFFTAERLVMYAGSFIALGIILMLRNSHHTAVLE